jgi:hypothetical protein
MMHRIIIEAIGFTISEQDDTPGAIVVYWRKKQVVVSKQHIIKVIGYKKFIEKLAD